MDTSDLTSQVATIIGQLHGLFDDIGLAAHERETREAELFTALSETLHKQVHHVASEKREMTEEANRLITLIKQKEASLEGPKQGSQYGKTNEEDLKVYFPLMQCLKSLTDKHERVNKVHKERFEQIKKLVEALDSYASHLEPTFLKIELPPTTSNNDVPPTFDLSPAYVNSLDAEFSRVYEEYNRRVSVVQSASEEIVKLWAELGTPQAQTDSDVVRYYREAPEQLGLHSEDIARLKGKKEKLVGEKKARENRLKELKQAVEGLWDRLGVETADRKAFLNANRGCGLRSINEFEDELSRLNELKRQNLHLFVEDARFKLQDLWDTLYFSEEEMLEFTPAFSDVYSDALLSAHEAEIERLEALKGQRASTLALIDKHRKLIKDREDLSSSSQDASRLMMKGQKGEKRDPGKLLREEKMRKRIAKELPKVEVDLRKILEQWEDEYGRPFLVLGERYLDELEAASAAKAVPARSKTPNALPPSNRGPASVQRGPPPTRSAPSRAGTRTPMDSIRRPMPPPSSHSRVPKAQSPSKIPSRKPLGHLTHGNNSPERRALPVPPSQPSHHRDEVAGKMGPPARAPPPKMRDFEEAIPRHAPANALTYDNSQRSTSASSSVNGSVRHVSPEDVVYEDYERMSYLPASISQSQQMQRVPGPPHQHHHHQSFQSSVTSDASRAYEQHSLASSRQISATSSVTNHTVSGSENWETFDDASDSSEFGANDRDASTSSYHRGLRATQQQCGGKRVAPDQHQQQSDSAMMGAKRHRGGLLGAGPQTLFEEVEGGAPGRVPSGSEAGWVEYD